MSYQIKRTPYFQRMFNNSRRNGQLQRLREEYERIQEFNDRTIELKMRQVRLKRLFREIEDINESPAAVGGQSITATALTRRSTQQQHQFLLTPDALQAQQRRERVEALERARELGQEMSRRNAELAENGSGFYLRSELRATSKMRAADEARRDAQERRQRAARRISYGNAQSRSNIERIAQRRQRQEETDALLYRRSGNPGQSSPRLSQQMQQIEQEREQAAVQQADIIKRSMLQQRLQYGNSRSSNNMMRSQMVNAQRVINCIAVAEQVIDSAPLHIASDNNTSNETYEAPNQRISNVNSEDDMQTALLPPTEPEPAADTERLSFDDNMPSTSQQALRSNSDLAAATTTLISDYTSTTPQPSRLLAVSASERATERWHRISLTLPWLKLTASNDHRDLRANAPNISISIAGDDLSGKTNGRPASLARNSENYQGFRRPSLLQEDIMQIIELDDRPFHN